MSPLFWTHPSRGGKPHVQGGSFEGVVVRSVIGGSEDRGTLALGGSGLSRWGAREGIGTRTF